MKEQRLGGSTSAVFDDCESLVSVSPVDTADNLSTDGSSSNAPVAAGASDAEDSPLSDDADLSLSQSFYNAQHDDVCSWRTPRRSTQRRHADYRQHAAADIPRAADRCHQEHGMFDGGEMATIRKLELELMAGDLSRQMCSMQQLMRLLSSETSQLASIIDDEKRRRRYNTDAQSKRRTSRHNILPPKSLNVPAASVAGDEMSSDNNELYHDENNQKLSAAANVSSTTQQLLLSAAIDELKSVCMMMSATLQGVTADNRSATSHDSAAGMSPVSNNTNNANEDNNINKLEPNDKETKADDDDDQSLSTVNNNTYATAAAAADDDDDHYEDVDKDNEYNTTKVGAKSCFQLESNYVWNCCTTVAQQLCNSSATVACTCGHPLMLVYGIGPSFKANFCGLRFGLASVDF